MQQSIDSQPLMHQVMEVANERAEAEAVVGIMQRLHAQGRHAWKDMAILHRTNAQSRLFEEQLVSCKCCTKQQACALVFCVAWACKRLLYMPGPVLPAEVPQTFSSVAQLCVCQAIQGKPHTLHDQQLLDVSSHAHGECCKLLPDWRGGHTGLPQHWCLRLAPCLPSCSCCMLPQVCLSVSGT